MSFKKILLSSCLLMFWSGIKSQDFTTMVAKAWGHNQQLKAKEFQLESANLQLQEAKSMYGPTASFGVQYTLAAGGRSIQLPVGDLLNPVYSTLNSITQSNQFPTIQNVEEQFLPNNFYDARFRINQPIYYPDLAINKKIKKESAEQKNLEVLAFKRLIAKEVMSSYFILESANRAVEIYRANDTLLTEAKRVTQSMIKNGIALPSALARIETQQSLLYSTTLEAEGNIRNALSYFEFITGENDVQKLNLPELPDPNAGNIQVREEILQIDKGQSMLALAIQKEESFYLPRIGAQLDLGSQDFNFGFQPYALFGINAEINLFDNKRHQHRKSSYQAESIALGKQKEYVFDQFELQKTITLQNLETAILQAKTFEARMNAVKKLYNEIFTKYKEGSANYLELLDAQTQITQIQIQYNLARQNAWLKWADYVYSTASYPIF
ncbi:MAG: TolC family protein [Saprospiraceae bacterium]|nr:TolC family protein [Saprospiraceae bacterium]